jgi:hypothetical protein
MDESAADDNGRSVSPLPLSTGVKSQPMSLAERGAAIEREFAQLEAEARKRASKGRAISPNPSPLRSVGSPSHRTPRSAFDSRLADQLSQRSQRSAVSHRTPRDRPRSPLKTNLQQNAFGEGAHFEKVFEYSGVRGMGRRPLGGYQVP